jgi:hypothetical protein
MPRKWLRLIAWVSLAAFLATNTYAGTAAAVHLTPSAPRTNPATVPAPAADDEVTPCCKHCAKKARDAYPPARAEPAPDPCPDGPCCPKGPCCPCPGGCALCNVVKVPCLAPSVPFLFAAPCLGDRPGEAAPLYTSPFHERLTRPPKL